jgi:predicted MFS family arabinose efflux permease
VPITPLRLFKSRDRSFSYLARLALVGGMFGMFFFLTQFEQNILGYSALVSGLAFLPLTIALFTASQLSARRLMPLFGGKALMVSGISTSTVGVLLLTQLSADSGYLLILAALVLFGTGNGLAFVPLTMASLGGVDPKDAGAASGLVNVAHQLGGSLGLGVLVTVFASATPGDLDAQAALADRISTSLTVGTGMLVLALAVVVALIVRPRKDEEIATATQLAPPAAIEEALTREAA